MSETPSKEEAIRTVILDGAAGDYVDIADLVKSRFRIDVSVALVEQVAIKLREEKSHGQVDSRTSSTSGPPSDTPHDALALKFVEAVGGFQAARKAIDDLESSVKKLL